MSSLMESGWGSTSPRPSRRSELTTDRERSVTSWGERARNGNLLSAPSEWRNSPSHPPTHGSMFFHRPGSQEAYLLSTGISDRPLASFGPYLGGASQGCQLPGRWLEERLGGFPDAVAPPPWFAPDRRSPGFLEPPSTVPAAPLGAAGLGLGAPTPPCVYGPPLVAPLLPGLWPTPPASFWGRCGP